MKDQLLQKIKDKSAVIGIYGLGYVGLPLALRFNQEGYNVLGFDVDNSKVSQINKGQSYIEHIPAAKISEQVDAKRLSATTDFSKTTQADALIICVPTPLNKYREPDISYIVSTMEMCLPYLRKGQVISLESTTYPGTTDEEIVPRAEKKGLRVGQDVFVVFSPEREDPGRKDFDTKTIPKVCGGFTRNCLDVGVALYGAVIDKVVPVSSTRAAEMTKLLENIHRSVNIGLVNEMKIVADKMNIDIHEVVRAAATKPFGFVPYYPGPGLGGHCIPIDPFYLTWKAREYGVHTKFIELAGEINSQMPEYVVHKVVEGLNAHGKAVKGSRVLVMGIAYKKNIDDMRESPALPIMASLKTKGAEVEYTDPHVPEFPKGHHGHVADGEWMSDLSSVACDAANVAKFDCCVIVTDHDKFDYMMLQKTAKLIVDSRGRYLEPMKNVVKA